MQIMMTSDVGETKRAALLYLMGCFCNDEVSFPRTDFSRFSSIRLSTEDLIAALELPEADLRDCAAWNISSEQWYSDLRQALYQHIVDALQYEAESELPEPVIHGRPGQC